MCILVFPFLDAAFLPKSKNNSFILFGSINEYRTLKPDWSRILMGIGGKDFLYHWNLHGEIEIKLNLHLRSLENQNDNIFQKS